MGKGRGEAGWESRRATGFGAPLEHLPGAGLEPWGQGARSQESHRRLQKSPGQVGSLGIQPGLVAGQEQQGDSRPCPMGRGGQGARG